MDLNPNKVSKKIQNPRVGFPLFVIASLTLGAVSASADPLLECIQAARDTYQAKIGGFDTSDLTRVCAGVSTAYQVSQCLPAAKAVLRAAVGGYNNEGLATACSNGTTADQLQECIPAATKALRKFGGVDYDDPAIACSGGGYGPQVSACISSAALALRKVGGGYSSKDLATSCSQGGTVPRTWLNKADTDLVQCKNSFNTCNNEITEINSSLPKSPAVSQKQFEKAYSDINAILNADLPGGKPVAPAQ